MVIPQKITLFLVLCPLLMAVSLYYALYYYRHESTGLGTGFMLVLVCGALVALLLDRLFVRYIPAGWLSIVEGVLVVVGVVRFVYTDRVSTLDLLANQSPYFVLIWTKTASDATPFQRVFPFSKRLVVSDANRVRLDQREFEQTDVKTPSGWGNSYFSRGIALTHPRFASAYFYAPEHHPYSPAQIDSLVNSIVAQESH